MASARAGEREIGQHRQASTLMADAGDRALAPIEIDLICRRPAD
jgi:hypothetical protein